MASTYSNDILVCGLFSDTLETYQLPILLTSAGRFVFDGFILKISECQLPLEEIIYETICKQETYNYFGTDKSESGIYEHKIKNQAGCDSIIYQLNLTVLENAFSDEFVETCIPHTWNGTTYDQSGIYTYQTISTNGCDSIATLDLTIHHITESATVISSCDTFDWNGQTYLQSGEYTFQTQNVRGCDSIANLFLTITPSYLDTSFITTYDDYF